MIFITRRGPFSREPFPIYFRIYCTIRSRMNWEPARARDFTSERTLSLFTTPLTGHWVHMYTKVLFYVYKGLGAIDGFRINCTWSSRPVQTFVNFSLSTIFASHTPFRSYSLPYAGIHKYLLGFIAQTTRPSPQFNLSWIFSLQELSNYKHLYMELQVDNLVWEWWVAVCDVFSFSWI